MASAIWTGRESCARFNSPKCLCAAHLAAGMRKGVCRTVTTASEMPPAVRLRAMRRVLDSRCLRSGLRVSKKSRTRKAIAVAAAPPHRTSRVCPFMRWKMPAPREFTSFQSGVLATLPSSVARFLPFDAGEESYDATAGPQEAGKAAPDDRERVHPRRGRRLYRSRRASRLERRGAARQRRHRVREKHSRRRVGPQHRGPSRPDAAHPDDRRAALHRAGLLPGAHARSRAVSDRGPHRRHPPDSGPDGAVRHALREGKHRRISERDAGARPADSHGRRPGRLPAHPAQALAGHTLQGSGLGSSVILRLATRQSLRRSRGRAKAAMATARGYGSPAKAESRYGDGASDLSSEAHCAKEEATKTLPPGSNNGSARGASPGGTRDSRRASEAPGMRPAPPTATERLLLTSRRPFRSW